MPENHDQQTVRVIRPYWLDEYGAWVFDDPAKGLRREPFVEGASDLITRLVRDIDDARDGFRLYFSTVPFPGYQLHLLRQFPERGGHWYATADCMREAWLCGALMRYFAEPPDELYIRAESREAD
jgi:hypothetical protein